MEKSNEDKLLVDNQYESIPLDSDEELKENASSKLKSDSLGY